MSKMEENLSTPLRSSGYKGAYNFMSEGLVIGYRRANPEKTRADDERHWRAMELLRQNPPTGDRGMDTDASTEELLRKRMDALRGGRAHVWKVGDKFIGREWDVVGSEIGFVPEMLPLVGKVLTVSEVKFDQKIIRSSPPHDWNWLTEYCEYVE